MDEQNSDLEQKLLEFRSCANVQKPAPLRLPPMEEAVNSVFREVLLISLLHITSSLFRSHQFKSLLRFTLVHLSLRFTLVHLSLRFTLVHLPSHRITHRNFEAHRD